MVCIQFKIFVALLINFISPHINHIVDDGRLHFCQISYGEIAEDKTDIAYYAWPMGHPDYHPTIIDGVTYYPRLTCYAMTPEWWLYCIAENWLNEYDYQSDTTQYGDLHRDGIINFKDFAIIAQNMKWP